MKVAFYKGTRPGIEALFSIGVRWWTGGPYSHCELVFDTDAYGVSTCGSSSFLDGGVRIKSIELNDGNWDLVDVAGDAAAARKWFADNDGRSYDLLGLVFQVWAHRDGSRGKFICSEAVGSALGWVETWRFYPNALAAAVRSFTLSEAVAK